MAGEAVSVMTSAVPPTVATYTPVPSCTLAREALSVRAVPAPNPVNLYVAIGILAVTVVCPSFVTQFERPVARSAVRSLNTVGSIAVAATTGCPEVLIWKRPEPLKLTRHLRYSAESCPRFFLDSTIFDKASTLSVRFATVSFRTSFSRWREDIFIAGPSN